MNRKIKFRIWDKQYKILAMVTHLDFITDELDHYENTGEPKSIEHFELMQYTGLKDKNGKEIYEGDLIKILEGYREHLKATFEIVFFEGAFCLKNIKQTIEDQKPTAIITYADRCYENGFELSVNNYIEVIGNIYENPELLK